LEEPDQKQLVNFLFIYLSIIINGSATLDGPWPSQANIARKDVYPCHPPANFYNRVSLRLPVPRQSTFILVGHVPVEFQSLSLMSF